MAKKIRVGVIGYGWVATAHIPALNSLPNVEVAAVYSSRPLDAAELSSKWGGSIAAYNDYDAMLADKSIDAVSICSYPHQHAAQAIKAAKAGKHIIIEKPLALAWKDCLAIEKAVKAANVKVCVCFECRFSSQMIATKAVIDTGLLGEIHYGEVDYYHGIGPWYGQHRWNTKKEDGGSALLTAGCHALDALLLCMGGDVASVMSSSTQSRSPVYASYEYHTTSVTIVNFKNGAIGKCAAVVDCMQPYYFHTHLCGSEGSLLDNKFHSMKLKTEKSHWSELSLKMLDSGDVSDHPYTMQFKAFFEALEKGQDMPLTNLANALNTHRVIFAADESARTKKMVKV
ncbi:MAG: Gfo/Idh/MocA family oxidoreductase [Planctomycetota bacterium]